MRKTALIMILIITVYAAIASFFPELNFQAKGVLLPSVVWGIINGLYLLVAFILFIASPDKETEEVDDD